MAAPYNVAWLGLRHDEAKIARLALIGDRWSGAQLLDAGIATLCVDDSEVREATTSLAQKLAAYPDKGLIRVKAGMRARVHESADEWFDRFTHADPVGDKPKPKRMS